MEHEQPDVEFNGQPQDQLWDVLAAEESLISQERRPFEAGEIIRMRPDVVRIDPSTGQEVIPLVFVQGMVGGDEKLPGNMEAFVRGDQREVIGLQYSAGLEGSAKLGEVEGLVAPLPQLDEVQAWDLLAALDELGIERADMVAVSRGAIRGVAAMGLEPDRFRDAYLVHPVALDGRSYRQRHTDAARAAVHKVAEKAGENAGEPTPKLERDGGLLDSVRDARLEQKSVARSNIAAILAQAISANPELKVLVAGDTGDRAILPERLQQTIEGTGASFVETNWGGHGIGGNAKAVEEIIEQLHVMEAAKK